MFSICVSSSLVNFIPLKSATLKIMVISDL
jgi:hypothetical protein